MSYILDALQRAQQERQRNRWQETRVSQLSIAEPTPAPSAPRRGWWLAGVLAALAALGGGWWWSQRSPAVIEAPSPNPVAEEVVPASPVPAEPVAAGGGPALEAAAAPAAVPEAAPASAPAPEPGAAPVPAAVPSAAPAAVEAPHPAVVHRPVPAKQRVSAPAGRDKDREARSDKPQADGLVFAQEDLPPAVRSQLPALQLSGVSYSSHARYRMAIVNGQVLHEGDTAAPGLVLERIEPQRTVWVFKGYRYALASQ